MIMLLIFTNINQNKYFRKNQKDHNFKNIVK